MGEKITNKKEVDICIFFLFFQSCVYWQQFISRERSEIKKNDCLCMAKQKVKRRPWVMLQMDTTQ